MTRMWHLQSSVAPSGQITLREAHNAGPPDLPGCDWVQGLLTRARRQKRIWGLSGTFGVPGLAGVQA